MPRFAAILEDCKALVGPIGKHAGSATRAVILPLWLCYPPSPSPWASSARARMVGLSRYRPWLTRRRAVAASSLASRPSLGVPGVPARPSWGRVRHRLRFASEEVGPSALGAHLWVGGRRTRLIPNDINWLTPRVRRKPCPPSASTSKEAREHSSEPSPGMVWLPAP